MFACGALSILELLCGKAITGLNGSAITEDSLLISLR